MNKRFTKRYYEKLKESGGLSYKLKTEIMNLPANAKVLDMGCGRGDVLKNIHEIRPDLPLFGTDIGDVEDFMPNYVVFKKEAVDRTSFSEDYFDFVILKMVLEHIPQPENVILEVKRIIKPTGRGYISVPHYKSIYLPEPSNFWGDYTHVRPFAKRAIRTLLSDYNLLVVALDAGISLKRRIIWICYSFFKFLFSKGERKEYYYNNIWVHIWGYSPIECIFEVERPKKLMNITKTKQV